MSESYRREVFERMAISEPLTLPMGVLLAIFAVVFGLQIASPAFNAFAVNYLALDTAAFLGKLYLWQAVTAIFLHGGVCHFVGNMLLFWFCGNQLANAWRKWEFLAFFFTCGIVASLCFFAFVRPFQPVGGPGIRGLGASGAVFGLMTAYAMIYGERIILLFPGIPMKGKHFVALCIILQILLLVGTSGAAQVAHLGGAVCGWAYLRIAWRTERGLAGVAKGPVKAKSRIHGLEVMDDDLR